MKMSQPEPKKEILEVLKKHGIITEMETGKVIIHLSCGGITKVCMPDRNVLK